MRGIYVKDIKVFLVRVKKGKIKNIWENMLPAAARGIALCVRPAQGYCFCWEGFTCLKPSKVEKASPAADLLGSWG